MTPFQRGIKAGIPIAVGYLSVSFSLGLIAVSAGLRAWEATLLSFLTMTSAGQFSAIQSIATASGVLPLLLSQLTINVRYSFMSLSLAQKADARFRGLFRWLLAFFMTDEIFAVASAEASVSPEFFTGLSMLPWAGWTLGTALGGLVGSILPETVMGVLGLALYGMFIAIVLPAAHDDRKIIPVLLVSMGISLLFYYCLPKVPSGISVSVAAIAAAALGAFLAPVKGGGEHD